MGKLPKDIIFTAGVGALLIFVWNIKGLFFFSYNEIVSLSRIL